MIYNWGMNLAEAQAAMRARWKKKLTEKRIRENPFNIVRRAAEKAERHRRTSKRNMRVYRRRLKLKAKLVRIQEKMDKVAAKLQAAEDRLIKRELKNRRRLTAEDGTLRGLQDSTTMSDADLKTYAPSFRNAYTLARTQKASIEEELRAAQQPQQQDSAA